MGLHCSHRMTASISFHINKSFVWLKKSRHICHLEGHPPPPSTHTHTQTIIIKTRKTKERKQQNNTRRKKPVSTSNYTVINNSKKAPPLFFQSKKKTQNKADAWFNIRIIFDYDYFFNMIDILHGYVINVL